MDRAIDLQLSEVIMYIPPAFQESRPEVLRHLIRTHPLGWLISDGSLGLEATPLPFLLYPQEGPNGLLRAHIARSNGHGLDLGTVRACMVLFQGEQGYVSPAWYATKARTGEVVPTWNYLAVQAWGKPELKEDPAWLQRLLEDLTAAQEGLRPRAWAPGDAPEAFIAKQSQAILGVEIAIARIQGKWKLSQNRSPEDRAGVIAGMGDPADPHHNAPLADLVAQRLGEAEGR